MKMEEENTYQSVVLVSPELRDREEHSVLKNGLGLRMRVCGWIGGLGVGLYIYLLFKLFLKLRDK